MESVLCSFKHISTETAKNILLYAQIAGEFRCSETYVAKRKKYDSILIMVTVSGKGYLKYRNRSYEISKGIGAIIDCNEPHVYFTDKKDLWHFMWIHFKGGQSMEQVSYILENSGVLFDANKIPAVSENTSKIIKMASNNGIESDIQISGCLNEIMTCLMLNSLPQSGVKKELPEIVKRALNIIEISYTKELNLGELATQLFTNKYDIIRKFKKYLGTTPYEYLIALRIKQAKELLETTQLTIIEVAENVGFIDSSYFIKVFRQHEGITPLKYRKYWERY